ncbi:MAG: hypothetical protein HN981_02720 [Candidatus Pacebacteria bacterium]|jgi:hypothetical protein|nr:hypothetical protein [Candidatus Paceibacterota bacterium]MBT4652595.1 hypothetical protein [Candidatus Paceibacterota bacterium]MBT6756422.1 hypothetical protein [Candidatus Paceibacterota bacterium]MBT6921284.1 hypothetical protein [Candidatus Paceibacterota bacterium]
MEEKQFLKLLEKEAFQQSILEKNHLLPDKIGALSSVFVRNTLKFIVVFSALLSAIKVGLLK